MHAELARQFGHGVFVLNAAACFSRLHIIAHPDPQAVLSERISTWPPAQIRRLHKSLTELSLGLE